MDEPRDLRFFWILVFALLLLTRIPAMPTYFGVDNVNLALSLEKFDPRIHQPQPPGYPFFVAFGRFINFFFHDARRTFLVISVLISALCLPVAYSLGRRMFSPSAGMAAALLLLVNPVFWYASIDPNGGPLRPFLGLFALLTAYCSWRCWMGETRFAIWGAVALGVGSGFRPDLIAFLFPLWFIASWLGTRSWRTILLGCAVLSGIALVWTGAVVLAMRGSSLKDDIQVFTKLMLDYTVEQSKTESVVFGSSIIAWLRQVNRLVIWNGLAIVTWIWAVPFYFRALKRVSATSSQSLFLLLWLAPGLIVQALVHIGAPGHTLFSVAGLCVIGGYFLSLAPVRDLMVGAALVLNVMLFLDFFALPTGVANAADGLPSVKNALLFGTFESSIGQVRWLDEITNATLNEIRQFTPKDRPSMIISTNTYTKQWFMNWRIGRYYLPSQDFWILYNDLAKKRAERVRRDAVVDLREIEPLRLPIFQEGRILWLIEPGSAIHKELAATQKLLGGKYVLYSDVTKDSPPFRIDDFEIVPSLFSFLPQTARVIASP
jgi:Dolichyl-phosphate-mannose-protein mannosyltransferase